MPGLLDFFESPTGQGLLGAAFGALSGRGSTAQAIGQGGLLGLNAYQGAKDQLVADDMQKKRGLLYDAQISNYQAEAAARQQAADQEAQRKALLASPQRPGAAQWVRLGGKLDELEGINNFGLPKVARTVDSMDAQGNKTTLQLDERGGVVGNALPAWVPPVMVDAGGRVVFMRPQAGASVTKTMTPDGAAADARGRAGLRQQREEFDYKRQRDSKSDAGDGYSTKPLPTQALKMQNEALDALAASGNVETLLSVKQQQIKDGKLSFGPVSNLYNQARNVSGHSDESSRNFASFRSDLERLRNESLRLNAGVQTEGDAQRAWNELFQNINDTELVGSRLAEIQSINKRAADLQRLKIDGIRGNYNAAPFDYNQLPTSGPKTQAQTNQSGLPSQDAIAAELARRSHR